MEVPPATDLGNSSYQKNQSPRNLGAEAVLTTTEGILLHE